MSPPDGEGPGRIVAVVASEGAVEGGWAASAALDLARSWSGSGAKIVLADGGLHYPTLHTEALIENVEGLSDAALFGLSIGRVARPIDGGAFFLITAGTAVANANSVPSSARWGRLLDGFAEAGVSLVIFLRDGESGCAAFLGSASDIVVLSAKGEKIPAAVRDRQELVRAVAGPDDAPTPRVGPPAGWTAKSPEERRRILLIAAVVVVLVVLMLIAASCMGPPDPAPGQTGAALRAPGHEVASVIA
ncbi:MAG TPA: hypothetical protein VLA09_14010 [Longimicrobiales bacterium]|nr:hypothetical protein [Longimicrobiales bacterium]